MTDEKKTTFNNAANNEPDKTPDNAVKKNANKKVNKRNKVLYDLAEKNVENPCTKDYIQNRIIPEMDYYSTRSREYSKKYQGWMTVSIILSALIPVLSILIEENGVIKITIALCGAAVTGLNAYLSLKSYKDLWLRYRTTRETLLSALYCYFNNARMFEKENDPRQKDILLVNLCEDILNDENGGWREIMTQNSSPEKSDSRTDSVKPSDKLKTDKE